MILSTVQGQINVLKFKNYSPTFFQNTKTVPQLKSSTSIHYKGSNFKQDLLKSSTCLRKYSLNLHNSLLSEEEFHMCTLKIFPKITVNFSLSLKVKTLPICCYEFIWDALHPRNFSPKWQIWETVPLRLRAHKDNYLPLRIWNP